MSDRYRPPPNRRLGLLEPDLSSSQFNNAFFPRSCQGGYTRFNYNRNSNIVNRHNNSETFHNSTISNNNHSVSTIGSSQCWNCDRYGHRYTECYRQKSIFCHSCGNKGVVKNDCPNCSKNAFPGGSQGHTEAVTCTNKQDKSQQPSTSFQNQKNGTPKKNRN